VIKGKTVRTKPNPVMIDIYTAVKEKHNIILAVDIMQFTSLISLVTVSRNIKFITAMHLSDQKKKTIVHAVKQAIAVYQGKGHTVTDIEFTETEKKPIHPILADNEFEAIREKKGKCDIRVNVTAKSEHVPEVERQNRVIKERARAIIQTLPYNHTPKKIRIALIQYVVFWLNSIPKNGQDYSTRDLIFGERKLNYDTDKNSIMIQCVRYPLEPMHKFIMTLK
jgi:hypothetical protein